MPILAVRKLTRSSSLLAGWLCSGLLVLMLGTRSSAFRPTSLPRYMGVRAADARQHPCRGLYPRSCRARLSMSYTPGQKEMEWAQRFQEALIIEGQEICCVAYQGTMSTGSKGTVVINADIKLPDGHHPVSFRTLEDILESGVPGIKVTEEEKESIAERVIEMDPENEVAVLMNYKGRVGMNVVRPETAPRYVYEMVFRGTKKRM